MKKHILVVAILSMVGLSCTNGSASSPGDPGTAATVHETTASVVAEGSGPDTNSPTVSSGHPVKLTKQDFLEKVMNYEKNQTEWVYEGELPALIDFYADWCGPCKIAAPVLEELAAEYEGKIHVYKVDTEAERELAAVFGIRSIPAFLFVPAEGRPTMSNGIAQTPEQTKEMFRQMIDEILLGQKPTS